MIVLGIQKNHHSSICLYEDNKLIYYCEEERLSRIKKAECVPFHCLNQIKNNFLKKIDYVVVTGYDCNESDELIAFYLKYIGLIDNLNQLRFFHKSHHLLHAAKAFYNSGYEDALVFVVDGRGSSFNLTNGQIAYETSSIYHFKNQNYFNCIYKKFYTNLENVNNLNITFSEHQVFYNVPILSINEKTKIEINNKNDIGNFYAQISNHFGYFGEEGKLMGLSAYGHYNEDLNKIFNSGDFWYENFGDRKNNMLLNINKYSKLKLNEKNYEQLINLSFLTQKKFEEDYLNFINKKFDKDLSGNLIITGGTGYNVVNNFKLKKEFKNMYVDPICGDEGNSIAACQFFLKSVNPEIKFNKVTNLFIGNQYNYDIQLNDEEFLSKKTSTSEIVKLLENGNIIALYQGRSEGGPRALGNRSLLMDARIKNGKEIMNKIKKREWFRPFACSILKEEVHNWFDLADLEESPFMMYAVQANKNVNEKISSVIHVDNTCRVQTVTENYNKILYSLLKLFYEKTNTPILMHTSFNLAGDPLVETPEDALNTLKNSELKYIYFADKDLLVYKKA